MHVYRDIHNLPVFRNAIITIGTFDGVHTGHQQILNQLLEEAKAVNGAAVVITFHPHPRQVVSDGKHPVYMLNTPEEKYHLLHANGIQHVVVVPFDKAFSDQPPSVYIEDFLIKRFHPHTIIIGYDHRFGKNREGDYHLLEVAGEEFGFRVKEIPEHVLKNITISSTKIREALTNGQIGIANEFLGYRYFFSGVVITGNKLGRTIGFPTANLHITENYKLIPAFGVYAVKLKIEGMEKSFTGMMNIGIRPTVGGTGRVIEVNIFEFDEDIYGKVLTVHLFERLREEVKFDSLDGLKKQLLKDKQDTLKLFSSLSSS